MTDALKMLIEAAKTVQQSSDDVEKQRRSFAYGNTKFENDTITWDMVNRQADLLSGKSSD
ncbi:MAG: hypothetical protein JKX93_19205 [Rhizobiaceae bacterium]|nr:hypothetical protein [Rhizobiaceae bacterium]MBL4695476.1 hypothetical protein [Rhizobiaceae bacterium]